MTSREKWNSKCSSGCEFDLQYPTSIDWISMSLVQIVALIITPLNQETSPCDNEAGKDCRVLKSPSVTSKPCVLSDKTCCNPLFCTPNSDFTETLSASEGSQVDASAAEDHSHDLRRLEMHPESPN